MEYKYHPIYKYFILLILMYMYLQHYKQISNSEFFVVSLIFAIMMFTLDYMLACDHYGMGIIGTKGQNIEGFNTDDCYGDDEYDESDEFDELKDNDSEHGNQHGNEQEDEIDELAGLDDNFDDIY